MIPISKNIIEEYSADALFPGPSQIPPGLRNLMAKIASAVGAYHGGGFSVEHAQSFANRIIGKCRGSLPADEVDKLLWSLQEQGVGEEDRRRLSIYLGEFGSELMSAFPVIGGKKI